MGPWRGLELQWTRHRLLGVVGNLIPVHSYSGIHEIENTTCVYNPRCRGSAAYRLGQPVAASAVWRLRNTSGSRIAEPITTGASERFFWAKMKRQPLAIRGLRAAIVWSVGGVGPFVREERRGAPRHHTQTVDWWWFRAILKIFGFDDPNRTISIHSRRPLFARSLRLVANHAYRRRPLHVFCNASHGFAIFRVIMLLGPNHRLLLPPPLSNTPNNWLSPLFPFLQHSFPHRRPPPLSLLPLPFANYHTRAQSVISSEPYNC